MPSLPASPGMASLPASDLRLPRARWLTLQAMGGLSLARLLIAMVPLRYWRGSLGPLGAGRENAAAVAFLASRVERAARRLPFETKCLPRAMALSWLLRRYRLDHALVLAVRGVAAREGADALHAWVEAGGRIVLGDEPGPWHEVFRA